MIASTNSLNPLPPAHVVPSRDEAWEARELKFHEENVRQINDMIRRMNAQAPSVARRTLITREMELDKIRGERLRNEVWTEVRRRAEEWKRQISAPSPSRGPAALFESDSLIRLRNATSRSLTTLTAPVNAIIGKAGGAGGIGIVRETPHSSGPDGGPSATNKGQPRLSGVVVIAGLGLGAYLIARRPLQNDSQAELNFIPVGEVETTARRPATPVKAIAPKRPPFSALRIVQAYIIEPIATLFRFLHLAILFGPVILTSPMLLVGQVERRRRRNGRPIADAEENWGAVWWYSFLVKQMERAGPSFIKLGQWAASRADLFPASLLEKMSKLHSNGTPHSMRHTRKVIEKAFDLTFEHIFEEFGEIPIGCGAIAQVYKAKLKPELLASSAKRGAASEQHLLSDQDPDGEPTTSVAIKVLHPHVQKIISRDIAIMSIFANVINAFPGMEWLSLPEEVAVFGEMMNSQLDLRVEASNLDRFDVNFRKRGRRVTFPKPIKLGRSLIGNEHEDGREVLMEEFEDALPLKYFLRNGGGPYDDKLASIGLDAFLVSGPWVDATAR